MVKSVLQLEGYVVPHETQLRKSNQTEDKHKGWDSKDCPCSNTSETAMVINGGGKKVEMRKQINDATVIRPLLTHLTRHDVTLYSNRIA